MTERLRKSLDGVEPAVSLGEQPSDLATLFPRQASIAAPTAGKLVRLKLSAEVLGSCRSDLSDLRIFDTNGREVPFVIESGLAAWSSLEAITVVPAKILDAQRETEERENAPALRRERYVIEPPPRPPAGAWWDLALGVGAPDFASRIEVRRIRVQEAQVDELRQLVNRYEKLAETTLDAQQRAAADMSELRTRTAAMEQILRTVE